MHAGVYKQARIIQFSLLSTETLDTGWMVRPQSKTKHCTSRKRKILNKTHKKKKVNVLTPGLLKRLQHVRETLRLVHDNY